MTDARFDKPMMKPMMDELDGHNCVKRTVSFGGQGALLGGFCGAANSALKIPDPEPTPLILQSFIMMKNNALFVGGIASTFALTTCTAAQMREKDDEVNWALGGAASGVFIGFVKRSWGFGCFTATVLAACAAVTKYRETYKHPVRTDGRVYV